MKQRCHYKIWAVIAGVILIFLELLLLFQVTTTCCNPIPVTQLTADWLMPRNETAEMYLEQTNTAVSILEQLQTSNAPREMGTLTPTPSS